MAKILGLDLGVTSIGYALIEENGDSRKIITMGSRIVPLDKDDKDEFSKGTKISKNQKRTTTRTQRKGFDRYQQRRLKLGQKLKNLNMYPSLETWKLPSLELYKLRNDALNEKLSLEQIGRIFMLLNQKRGYKSMAKEETSEDKKNTDYVAEVKGRYQTIKDLDLTVGQYFYQGLATNSRYRIKDQVFPREAYIEEFEKIWAFQALFYPDILTPSNKEIIQNEIIYFQRPLKSQKGLVSICEFEGKKINMVKEGKEKEIFIGPRVSPRSSPLFQIGKIWEVINSISLKSKTGEHLFINQEKKNEIYNHLDNNEKLSIADLFKILGVKKDDFYGNKQLSKGLQGNLTKYALIQILGASHDLLKFDLQILEDSTKEALLFDKKTGEILENKTKLIISPKIENEPLYQLWHTAYSIKDELECQKALIAKFNIAVNQAVKISKIDFTKAAFGNKSAKAIRKILPYLMQGYVYSSACSFAGYNHSNSLTKDEKKEKTFKEKLDLLPKNSLRQPIVEKILNQQVNVLNTLINKYGKPDEIRVELARELKQSIDERNDAFKYNNQREKENDSISKRLQEYQLKATRNNIIKWRLFHEISNEESKQNAVCIYCGKPFGITDALRGTNVDVEHIIPKSLLFDDSQCNKTLSHRSCNLAKGKLTAFDFMSGKNKNEFEDYIDRVNELYKKKIIGKTKRDKLLMPASKIPNDFIERQLRETQYIAKKSKELLEEICPNVWSTSGSVTERLRRVWGWDDVLMNLQFEKYKEIGLTEIIEWETREGEYTQNIKKKLLKNGVKEMTIGIMLLMHSRLHVLSKALFNE
jgi:CRISPR-associated endonuclease Csn1